MKALIAAFCIQTAVLAWYLHYPASGALLWIATGVLIVQNVKAVGGGMRRRTTRRMRDALATLIILSGLLRFFVVQYSSAGGDNYRPPDLKKGSSSKQREESSTSFDNSGDHTGVILLPEEQQHTTLVPPLPAMRSGLFDEKHQNPLTIPFYGAYWFFKFPDKKPPKNSYVTRGTPAQMTFHAPDSGPLLMEAHQNLGKLIDLDCCREIRVEIENNDPIPGTVSIELILVNTREGQEGEVSLGRAPVTSRPQGGPDGTMRETLTFPIPTHASIRQFDELTLRFPRERFRMSRSAKVAIERFVLVPRA